MINPDLPSADPRALLAAIVLSSHDAIVGNDVNGTVTTWNDAAQRIFGYEASEILGLPISILAFEGREKEMSTTMARVLRGEKVVPFETVRRHKDGAPVHMSITVSPIRDDDGRIVGASKVARDIGPARKSAEALRLAESRLAAIVLSSHDAIFGNDVNGVITTWNDAAQCILGYEASEIIGRSIKLLAFKGREKEMSTTMARVLRGEKVEPFETVRRHKDGAAVHMSITVSPIRDDEGRIVGASKVARDIGPARKAAEALRLAERRLAAIVLSSHDAIIAKDINGIVTTWNNAAERIFGYKADEVLGQSTNVLADPDREGEMAAVQARALSGEQVDHFESVSRHKNGAPVHVFLTVSPILDDEGCVVGTSNVARDITARRQATEALRKAMNQLREQVLHSARLAEVGQISANLVHEISQPIGAISSYLQAFHLLLASEATGTRARLKDAVGLATRQAERAGEILRRMRSFTRPHATKRAPMSVSEVIAESLSLAKLDRALRDIVLDIEPPPEDHLVVADKVEIQQVLLNLMRNAAEATEGQSRRLVRLSTTIGSEMVEIAVEDSGSGLAPEVRETLFQPFHTTKEDGMGVGLAICHSIVEAHGGKIWVEDRPGGGTIFRFTLPVARVT